MFSYLSPACCQLPVSIISVPECFLLELWGMFSSCMEQVGRELQRTNMAAPSIINDTRKLVCLYELVWEWLISVPFPGLLPFSVSLPCFLPILPTKISFLPIQLHISQMNNLYSHFISSIASGVTLGNRSSSSDPGSLTSQMAKEICCWWEEAWWQAILDLVDYFLVCFI